MSLREDADGLAVLQLGNRALDCTDIARGTVDGIGAERADQLRKTGDPEQRILCHPVDLDADGGDDNDGVEVCDVIGAEHEAGELILFGILGDVFGTDTGYFFLLAASLYGNEIYEKINQTPFNPVQSDFKFERISEKDGFINKKFFFIHFCPEYYIDKMDFDQDRFQEDYQEIIL